MYERPKPVRIEARPWQRIREYVGVAAVTLTLPLAGFRMAQEASEWSMQQVSRLDPTAEAFQPEYQDALERELVRLGYEPSEFSAQLGTRGNVYVQANNGECDLIIIMDPNTAEVRGIKSDLIRYDDVAPTGFSAEVTQDFTIEGACGGLLNDRDALGESPVKSFDAGTSGLNS